MASNFSLYNYPGAYRFVMKCLYRDDYNGKFFHIAKEIPEGSSVVDICAGDGALFRACLKEKQVNYLALDSSPQMVAECERQGLKTQLFDCWSDVIPSGDVIVMSSSLYQFLPDCEEILRRMLNAARHKVIITEPIHNLSSSAVPLLSGLSKWLTCPVGGKGRYQGSRFDADSLALLFSRFPEFNHSDTLPGGREMFGVFIKER